MAPGILGEFIASLKAGGEYAILSPDRRGLEWCAAQAVASEPGVVVRWDVGLIVWSNGARAALVVCADDDDLRGLRGLRLDSALMLWGGRDRPFPASTRLLLEQLAAGPEFKLWNASW